MAESNFSIGGEKTLGINYMSNLCRNCLRFNRYSSIAASQ
nr:MAG TPA: Protein of unknown function (DUF1244) [Caudoviricetes sp.]